MEHQTEPTTYGDMPRPPGSGVDANLHKGRTKVPPINSYTNPGTGRQWQYIVRTRPRRGMPKANSTLAKTA